MDRTLKLGSSHPSSFGYALTYDLGHPQVSCFLQPFEIFLNQTSVFLSYPTHILSQLIVSKVKGGIQQLLTWNERSIKCNIFLSTFRVKKVKVVRAWQAGGQKKTKLCPRSYWMTQKVKVFKSASHYELLNDPKGESF